MKRVYIVSDLAHKVYSDCSTVVVTYEQQITSPNVTLRSNHRIDFQGII